MIRRSKIRVAELKTGRHGPWRSKDRQILQLKRKELVVTNVGLMFRVSTLTDLIPWVNKDFPFTFAADSVWSWNLMLVKFFIVFFSSRFHSILVLTNGRYVCTCVFVVFLRPLIVEAISLSRLSLKHSQTPALLVGSIFSGVVCTFQVKSNLRKSFFSILLTGDHGAPARTSGTTSFSMAVFFCVCVNRKKEK